MTFPEQVREKEDTCNGRRGSRLPLPTITYLIDSGQDPNSSALPLVSLLLYFYRSLCVLCPSSCTMPAPSTLYRIKRKPPPSLDRYPSPDPADPFAPLWSLRNRTSSGLSRQDVPESDIVCRARSASYLYSTTTAHVSLNTPTTSPNSKIGHYSQSTLIDSSQAFPLISSLEQPVSDRPTNVRSPPRTHYLNDSTSSGTESGTASVPIHPPGSNHRFPKFLFKKAGCLNRSSIIDFKQARKSAVSPPVVSTVTWIHPASNDSSRFTSKFTASLSADLDETHQHHHNMGHPVPFDSKVGLKQDLPKQCKLPTLSIPQKTFRKRRISSSIPFLSTTAPRKRPISSSSYVHISMPTPVLQSTLEDAYTSPRKAPVPPPVSPSNILSKECSDKSCGLGYNCIHSISSEWGLPSLLQLNYAACLPIIGENGEQITFGSLFESQRTIVVFIRHFWCPLCQDYMSSINSFIRPEMICNTCESDDDGHEETIRGIDHDPGTRVRFVVISNGAHGMIAKYRQIFGLSFKLYTDPSLAVYQALGMDNDRRVKHHNEQTHREISEKNSNINKPGGYVKHSLMGGIAMVVVRAFKVGMPVWEKGGDIDQLGGEFVFGPG